jgi:hypothetical protein
MNPSWYECIRGVLAVVFSNNGNQVIGAIQAGLLPHLGFTKRERANSFRPDQD